MKKIIFLVLLFAVQVQAVTYFVSTTDGNDSDTGLTEALAWETIDKVNNFASFAAGDFILFNRGDTWREALDVPTNGSAGNPITFSAYGTGDDPIISAADIFRTWTADGGSYKKTITTEPLVVIYDGALLTENDTATNTVGSNEWDWDANSLWVNVGENPDTGILEAGQRDDCIKIHTQNYITVEHFTLEGANTFRGNIWLGNTSHNVILRNLTTRYSSTAGILIIETVKAVLIDSCVVYNNNQGIAITKNFATAGNEVIVQNCDVYLNAHVGIVCESTFSIVQNTKVHHNNTGRSAIGGIHVLSAIDDSEETGQNVIIRYNESYSNEGDGVTDGWGINADHWTEDTQIYGNIVYNNDGPGIALYGAIRVTLYNNVCYDNLQNYTVNPNKSEYSFTSNADNLTDLVVKNNIAFATQTGTYAVYIDSDTSDNVLTLTDNDWYATATNWWFDGSSAGSNLATWNAVSYVGTDINADPQFVDAANDNFHLAGNSPALGIGRYPDEFPLGRARYNRFSDMSSLGRTRGR